MRATIHNETSLHSVGANVAVAVVTGPDHKVAFANTAFENTFAVDVGRRLVECIIPAEAKHLIEVAWRTGKPQVVRRFRTMPGVDGSDETSWNCDIIPLPVDGAASVPTALVIAREVTREVELAGQLVEKDRLLDLIMSHVPWGITVASDNLRIGRMSDHGAELLQWPRDAYEGKTLDEVMGMPKIFDSEGKEAMPDVLPIARAVKRGEVILGEEWLVADPAGRRRKTILCNAAPLRGENDEVIGGITTFGDISAIKTMMQRLRDLLTEKEVLLSELHHRVKNNLQIISSLAMMEKVKNPHAAEVCDNLVARMEAVAKIHETLGLSRDASRVNFSSYVQKLFRELCDLYGKPNIALELSSAEELPLDVATPLGLIINELLCNVFKHAFEGSDSGTVTMSLTQVKDEYLLVLSDNGSGHALPKEGTSLGLRLVKGLLAQIAATLQVNSVPEHGTTWKIRFPRDPLSRAAAAP